MRQPRISMTTATTMMKISIGKRRIGLLRRRLQFAIEHPIDQRVGKNVLLARHVPDVDFGEAAQQPPRALVERLQPYVLHAIFAAELLHDQLGVEPNAETPDSALCGCLETQHERRPFGDVIGRDAEISADLLDELTLRVEQHGAAGGRPGVPARAAVGKEHGFHSPGPSPVRRHRPPGPWVLAEHDAFSSSSRGDGARHWYVLRSGADRTRSDDLDILRHYRARLDE